MCPHYRLATLKNDVGGAVVGAIVAVAFGAAGSDRSATVAAASVAAASVTVAAAGNALPAGARPRFLSMFETDFPLCAVVDVERGLAMSPFAYVALEEAA